MDAKQPDEGGWWNDQSQAFLECRDSTLRHQFKAVSADRDGRGFVEELKCGRCGVLKRRWLRADGSIRKTQIEDYPDGYLRKGLGRMTKQDNAEARLRGLQGRWAF